MGWRIHASWPTLVFLALLSAPGPVRATSAARDSLRAEVDSLRATALYTRALQVAEDLRRLVKSDSTAKPYEIGDAERLVATLRHINALPDSARSQVAEADRIQAKVTEAAVQGDCGEWVAAAQSQLATWRKWLGPDCYEVSSALVDLALLHENCGDYVKAEALHREAIEMQQRLLGDQHPEFATELNNLASNLAVRGDAAKAEPLQRQALALHRALLGNEHADVAQDCGNLGLLLWERGDLAASKPLALEALDTYRKVRGEQDLDVAISLNNLALVLRDSGDCAAADSLFREALEIKRTLFGERHPSIVWGINNLAEAQKCLNHFAAAESLHNESLRLRRELFGPQHVEVARSLNNLAFLAYESGRAATAAGLYEQSLEIYRRVLGQTHPYLVQTQTGLGCVLHELGKNRDAEVAFDAASRCFESARLRVGHGASRSSFTTSPYPGLAATRLLLGKDSGAWPAAERSLGRALGDVLREVQTKSLTVAERVQEDTLRVALSDAEQKHAAFLNEARSDSTAEARHRVEQARNELLEAEAKWSSFQAELSKVHPLEAGEPYSLARVQRNLGPKTAILGWVDVEWRKGKSESWGYAIRKTGPVHWEKLTPAMDSTSIRSALMDPSGRAGDQPQRELYRDRIAPLANQLKGSEQLVVLPSGGMLGIPVETLVDADGVALGERYAISYAPSATIYSWLREKKPRPHDDRPGLFLGDPVVSRRAPVAPVPEPGPLPKLVVATAPFWSQIFRSAAAGNDSALDALPPLPGTREEVEKSSQLFPGSKPLVGRDATEQALVDMAARGQLSSYRVLHFATHALTDDERPEQSALVLSRRDLPDALEAAIAGQRVYDGLVTAKEIVREWKIDADLVVLSGCETGLGKKVAGEGYLGLATAFLQVGARAVLVSLWSVDDRSTSLLIQRFYANWVGAGGSPAMSKAEALKAAKAWLRSQHEQLYAAPFFWAGFVLLGDPS